MLRLTKKADYGLMALKYLAEQADLAEKAGAELHLSGARSAKDIAEAYHIPPQLLAKILQTLARPAATISAFEAIRAIDGPLFITSCITIHGACDLAGHCTIKEPLRKVNDSITSLLSGISIADLTEPVDHLPAAMAGGLVSIER